MATKLHDTTPVTLTEARGPELLVPMHLRMPGHLARRFHRVHVAMMSEALAALELNAASYGALVSIARAPGITQRGLANERGLDAVTAGQTVDELERQGFVRRRADLDDRRAWRLELTAKGKRVRDRAAPAALAAQARMLAVLSNDEVTKLRELLARVIEANTDYDRPGAGRRRPSANRKSKREATMHRRSVLALLTAGLAMAGTGTAAADAWPAQAVKFITSGPPGSAPDLMARLFADRLAKRWKHAVVVENIPGAGGALAAKAFKRAEDGHTLLLAPSGVVMVAPVLQSKLPYDPNTDLFPIAAVTTDFLAFAAATAVEASSMKDLVAFARSKPGTLNWYASPGAPYLTFMNLIKRAELNMTYVPYRGASGSTMSDLVTGTLQAALVPLTAVRGLAADGKVRLLAVTNRERSLGFRTVPTIAEAGYPELEMEGVLGAFGWRGMPVDLSERIAQDFREAGRDDNLLKQFAAAGQIVRVTGPADYRTYLERERKKWTSIAVTVGVQPR